jgi:hypothetical protein
MHCCILLNIKTSVLSARPCISRIAVEDLRYLSAIDILWDNKERMAA